MVLGGQNEATAHIEACKTQATLPMFVRNVATIPQFFIHVTFANSLNRFLGVKHFFPRNDVP